MSVQLIPVPQARIGAPFVTGVLAVVFASGVVTGLSLPRAVESGSQVAALHDPAVQVPAFPGVADNNMSDAAYAALHRPTDDSSD